ncbi:unnamed protein product, partial [Ectocarpus fasciculatus]
RDNPFDVPLRTKAHPPLPPSPRDRHHPRAAAIADPNTSDQHRRIPAAQTNWYRHTQTHAFCVFHRSETDVFSLVSRPAQSMLIIIKHTHAPSKKPCATVTTHSALLEGLDV